MVGRGYLGVVVVVIIVVAVVVALPVIPVIPEQFFVDSLDVFGIINLGGQREKLE